MKRKLDIVRSQKRSDFPVLEIKQAEQIEAISSVKKSIDNLYEFMNGKEEYDFEKLADQLKLLNETLDLRKELNELKDEVKNSKTKVVEVDKLNDLIKVVKENKPLPVNIDLSKLEKAIIQVQQRIQESSTVEQAPEEFQPIRRVVKVGNRLVFDDQPTPTIRSGGGGTSSSSSSSSGLTDAELRASPVEVEGTVTVNTGLTDAQLRAADVKITLDGETVPVTGTFWQATQPVSGTVTATPTGTYTTKEVRSATPTQTSVNDTAVSTTLIASNANRLGATIFNDSTVALYVKLGGTASTTSFTIKLDAQDYYEIPFGYTGVVDGIWASDASGAARITELAS